MMLHHIQRTIIDVLAHEDPARYADLKPENMDGNQFTYHLKQLLTDKFITKNNDGTYSLTQVGRGYLVTRYEDKANMAHTIFLVVIKCDGKLLLRKRLVQPSLGYVGFVHGEPKNNELLKDTVIARILAKTGLKTQVVTPIASGLIRIIRGGEVESFSHTIIINATVESTKKLIESDDTGENFWAAEEDLESIKNILPSCHDILAIADEQSSSWFDRTYRL